MQPVNGWHAKQDSDVYEDRSVCKRVAAEVLHSPSKDQNHIDAAAASTSPMSTAVL